MNMEEIVGAQIGTKITNSFAAIVEAALANKPMQLLTKQRMQFMGALDLGPLWKAMANSPVLFVIDDDGKFRLPPDDYADSVSARVDETEWLTNNHT